ncbi:MAG: glycosyltransferase family 2 protein [Desulfuromonadales bacterium]|nr:glycosyltransferase family 2 protein [Desulfuromonadales bacterium]
MAPDLTVIVVNWNTRELLRDCLRSVVDGNPAGELSIIVVDNGSADGSAEMVEREFPRVRLLRNQENLGFAKANNQALRLVETPYACLLNSDTVVAPGTLAGLVSFMTAHPRTVACAPALRLPSGRLQTGGAGYELNLRTAFNYFFFLSRLFPERFPGMYLYQDHFVRKGEPLQVDWLAGACLSVRMTAVRQAGLLDESYHMYAEDAEWCQRLGRVGEIRYLPGLEILHLFGASSDKGGAVSVRWLDATFAYFERQHGRFRLKLFQLVCLGGFLLRMLLYGIGCPLRTGLCAQARAMGVYALHSGRRLPGR